MVIIFSVGGEISPIGTTEALIIVVGGVGLFCGKVVLSRGKMELGFNVNAHPKPVRLSHRRFYPVPTARANVFHFVTSIGEPESSLHISL